MQGDLAKEAARLYALPAGEYTAARNARAKALRADDAELAAAVAKLPKPSAAAAAVNELARDQPSEIRELTQAGKRLRSVQEGAVSGKGEAGEGLQAALRDHRAALERVGREARRLKLSEPVLARVLKTIRAASVDPELQPLLERGLLAEELESAGFGVDPALAAAAAAPPRRPAKAAAKREDTAAQRRKARERVAAAQEDLRKRERELRRAEKAAASAEQAAVEARERVAAAEAEVEQARQGLDG